MWMATVAKCSSIKKTSWYDRLTPRPQTHNLKIPLPPPPPPSPARVLRTHTRHSHDRGGMSRHARLAAKATLVRLVLSRVPRYLTHDAARAPHAAAHVLRNSAAFRRDGILGTHVLAKFHKRVDGVDGEGHPTSETCTHDPHGDRVVIEGVFGHLEGEREDHVAETEGEDHLEGVFGRGIRGGTAEPVEAKALQDLCHGDCVATSLQKE